MWVTDKWVKLTQPNHSKPMIDNSFYEGVIEWFTQPVCSKKLD